MNFYSLPQLILFEITCICMLDCPTVNFAILIHSNVQRGLWWVNGLEAINHINARSQNQEWSFVCLIPRHPLPQKCSSATEEVQPNIDLLLQVAGLSHRVPFFILLDCVQIRQSGEYTSLHIQQLILLSVRSISHSETREPNWGNVSHRARGWAEAIEAWIFTMKGLIKEGNGRESHEGNCKQSSIRLTFYTSRRIWSTSCCRQSPPPSCSFPLTYLASALNLWNKDLYLWPQA